jgi:hypothetical protein
MLAVAAIALFSALSFVMEGRVQLSQFWNVIDPLGGGGHHELFVSLIQQFKDPALYPQDLYLFANHYPVVPLISAVMAPLHAIVGLPINVLFVIAEQVSRILLFCSIYRLAKVWGANRYVGILAMALCLLPKCGIGYYYLYTATDFNADLALALNILSLSFFFQSRMTAAWLINGLSYNAHPILPFWITVIYVVYGIVQQPREKSFWTGPLVFLAAALPFGILVFRHLLASPEGAADKALWFQLIMPTLGSHFFASFQTRVDPFFWHRLFLYGMAGFLAYKKYPLPESRTRPLKWIAGGLFFIATTGIIFTDVFSIIPIIKTQPARSSVYLVVIAMIFIARFLYQETLSLGTALPPMQKAIRGLTAALVALAIAGHAVPPSYFWLIFLIMGLAYALSGTTPVTVKPRKVSLVVLGMLLLLPAPRLIQAYLKSPAETTLSADWKQAQLWAREHTAKEDQFILPLGLAGWRIFSERGAFTSMNDIAVEVLMNPRAGEECARRLRLMNYAGMISREAIRQDYRGLGRRIEEADRGFTEAHIRRIQAFYPAVRYMVAYRTKALTLPLLYENNTFRVYQIN